MSANLYLWAKIKKLNIDFFMKLELFEVIEKYLDRVRFVTNVLGHKDNLFLAERGTDFEHKTYVVLEYGMTGKNEKTTISKEKIETNFIRIMSSIKELFEKTEKTLYITIGFEKDEKENTGDTPYFPDWYIENSEGGIRKEEFLCNIDYVFNDIINVLEKNKTNKFINELLSKKKLTSEEKQLLKRLSLRQCKVKTPI